MKEKWLTSMEVFEDYERRFAQARLDRPVRAADMLPEVD